MRSPSRRLLLAVLLLAVLVHPAWGAHPARQARPPLDLLGWLWGALTGVWEAAGCIADPHGGCTPTSTAPGTDAGCIADPNGACSPTSAAPGTDEGCIADPHGGCAAFQAEPPMPAPSADEGCIADPNGGCTPRGF